MPNHPRSSRARRCTALLLVLLAASSIALLFAEWHVVRDHAIDADKVFLSLYQGPDVRVSDETRAALLDDGLNAGVTERWCSGIEHLGRATLAALAATLAFATLALFGAPGWRSGVPALAAVLAALAALAATWDAGFLRHLLEDVGPDSGAVAAFGILEKLALGAALLLCVCAWMERRTARSYGSGGSGH